MTMKKFAVAIWTVAGIVMLFQACGGSGSASGSTVTESELTALKAQLRVEVVQLAPAVAATSLRSYALGGSVTPAPAATTAPTPLGTSCGYDAPYPRTTQACIVDSQGVAVDVPYPNGGAYATMYPVFYNTLNCDDTGGGHAFIQRGPTTLTAVPSSGAVVFRVDPFTKGALDTSTYYHISAGTVDTQLNVQSEAQGDGNCIATTFGVPVGMLPITQGVTGSWKAQPTGPLAAGTPQ